MGGGNRILVRPKPEPSVMAEASTHEEVDYYDTIAAVVQAEMDFKWMCSGVQLVCSKIRCSR